MDGQNLDQGQAQDHLAMVDRILSEADRQVRLLPEPFIAFGIAGGIIDLVAQRVFVNGATPSLFWIGVVSWLIAILVAISSSRRLKRSKERLTVLDGQMYALFNVIWIVTLITAFGAQPHIFDGWAGAAIWSFAFAIAMIFAGTQGNRIAFAGGIVLAVSIVAANLFYPFAGYIFAAGMWIGMAGAGVALLATQRR